jgi:mannan endo-1,4-beta-mannosidase
MSGRHWSSRRRRLCLAVALYLPCVTACLRAHPPGGAPVEALAPSAATQPSTVAETGSPPASEGVPAAGHDVGETRAARDRMLRVLRQLASSPGFALGQQDATAYGVGWSGDTDRSDVKSVCGSHVAVYGWDIFGVEKGAAKNGDGVDFQHMRRLIGDAHRRGGLNTISWHMDNPRTGGNAWDRTPAVRDILPGGPRHERYVGFLDRAANYLQTLRGDSGELIPILFRPFHEHTGSWFWWGSSHTTERDYIALWRFTADYLRKQRGLDLLFAFSPGGGEVHGEGDYLYRYPGDEYVDVFGVDEYSGNDPSALVRLAEVVVRVAEAHAKIPAVTEFGARGGLNGSGIAPGWIEHSAIGPLLSSPVAARIAYALAWRNARVDHCFLPYPGHPSAAAFQSVCADDRLLLEVDLQHLE